MEATGSQSWSDDKAGEGKLRSHRKDSDSGARQDSLSPPQAAVLYQSIEQLERWRQLIGDEIHDGLTQQLAVALMYLNVAIDKQAAPCDELKACQSVLQDALGESRRLVEGFAAPLLDEQGVEAAFRDFLARNTVSKNTRIDLKFDSNLAGFRSWQRSALLLFLQEAVTNALKHSSASLIRVSVSETNSHIVVSIRDDGQGRKLADQSTSTTYGLRGLQKKAEILNGHFEMESQPEVGTSVTLTLPLPSTND